MARIVLVATLAILLVATSAVDAGLLGERRFRKDVAGLVGGVQEVRGDVQERVYGRVDGIRGRVDALREGAHEVIRGRVDGRIGGLVDDSLGGVRERVQRGVMITQDRPRLFSRGERFGKLSLPRMRKSLRKGNRAQEALERLFSKKRIGNLSLKRLDGKLNTLDRKVKNLLGSPKGLGPKRRKGTLGKRLVARNILDRNGPVRRALGVLKKASSRAMRPAALRRDEGALLVNGIGGVRPRQFDGLLESLPSLKSNRWGGRGSPLFDRKVAPLQKRPLEKLLTGEGLILGGRRGSLRRRKAGFLPPVAPRQKRVIGKLRTGEGLILAGRKGSFRGRKGLLAGRKPVVPLGGGFGDELFGRTKKPFGGRLKNRKIAKKFAGGGLLRGRSNKMFGRKKVDTDALAQVANGVSAGVELMLNSDSALSAGVVEALLNAAAGSGQVPEDLALALPPLRRRLDVPEPALLYGPEPALLYGPEPMLYGPEPALMYGPEPALMSDPSVGLTADHLLELLPLPQKGGPGKLRGDRRIARKSGEKKLFVRKADRVSKKLAQLKQKGERLVPLNFGAVKDRLAVGGLRPLPKRKFFKKKFVVLPSLPEFPPMAGGGVLADVKAGAALNRLGRKPLLDGLRARIGGARRPGNFFKVKRSCTRCNPKFGGGFFDGKLGYLLDKKKDKKFFGSKKSTSTTTTSPAPITSSSTSFVVTGTVPPTSTSSSISSSSSSSTTFEESTTTTVGPSTTTADQTTSTSYTSSEPSSSTSVASSSSSSSVPPTSSSTVETSSSSGTTTEQPSSTSSTSSSSTVEEPSTTSTTTEDPISSSTSTALPTSSSSTGTTGVTSSYSANVVVDGEEVPFYFDTGEMLAGLGFDGVTEADLRAIAAGSPIGESIMAAIGTLKEAQAEEGFVYGSGAADDILPV